MLIFKRRNFFEESELWKILIRDNHYKKKYISRDHLWGVDKLAKDDRGRTEV